MTQHSPNTTLLVTPDQEWSLSLSAYLAQHGFAASVIALTGDGALTLFHQLLPSLVLIDLRLTNYNVDDLCAAMFLAQPTVKVILISATDVDAPIIALASRIAGCVGRTLPLAAWPGLLTYVLQGGRAFNQYTVATALAATRFVQPRQPPLVIGTLHIDPAQRVVMYAGQRISLTAREFALLAYLARHPDRVISVDQLLSDAWGYDTDHGTPAQVRLYITRLRRKLLTHAQMPDFIHTTRGLGYRLDSTVLRSASGV
jgi:two-component system alkaline phosphatase synthesis response regulator PhoP